MEVCKRNRNSCVHVTITIKIVVIGKEQLKSEEEQITEVISMCMVDVKKDGIIVSQLLQKHLSLQNNFCYPLYVTVSLLWVLSFLNSCTSQFAKAIMHDKMERSLSLEYFLYIENISAATFTDIKCSTCSFTNCMKLI